MGVLTPAVVATAVSAVEPDRAGLAAGVNNTSRQASGVIGIAVYDAVAGSPTAHSGFLAGLHTAGLPTAGLHTAGLHTAALFTVAAIGHLRRHPR